MGAIHPNLMLMEADDNASDICIKRSPNQRSLMWTDGRSIYVELPTRENVPPCIITYRCSEGGLSKALPFSANTRTLPEPRHSPYPPDARRITLEPSANMPLPNPSCERGNYQMTLESILVIKFILMVGWIMQISQHNWTIESGIPNWVL